MFMESQTAPTFEAFESHSLASEHSSHFFDDGGDLDDMNQASHMENDEDEVDPELVECPKCEFVTHVSVGKCGNDQCDWVMKFTEAGYLDDGFMAKEDEIDYIDETEETEEEEFLDDESSDEEGYEEEAYCYGDDDEDWTP